jgi:nucleoside-diphosphate-sugar epimerase
VSTAHIYAPVQPPRRIQESDPIAPRSVYAKTKYEAEVALRELGKEQQVDILIARVFGIVAPSQPANYVLPGLLRRLREKDSSPIPGLRNVRDYLDARDICAHLVDLAALAEWPPNGLINVCSGEPTVIADLWTLLVNAIPSAKSLPAPREAFGRPDDIPWIVGDPDRLVQLLGHSPRLTPLHKTIKDALGNAPLRP